MKALLLTQHAPIESRPLTYVDLPKPTPQANELLVRVRVCAICRTDLHIVEGDLKRRSLPLILGHQIVGTVASKGASCKRFQIGKRVGVAWLRHTCGSCACCCSNKENLCEVSQYTGYDFNGGYAEYTTVPEDYAYEIPDIFSDAEAAPLLCAGIVGYRAYKRSEINPGGRLGIYGFGSSAHLIMQIARYQQCEVFVATRDERHQALARSMGAVWAGPAAVLPQIVDSIIVFAPAGELVPLALQSLRAGGTVSLADIHMTDIPSMEYQGCLFHEKNLRSVEANTRADGRELLALAEQIPIKPHTTEYRLEQANEALLQLKRHAIQGTAILRIP